MSRSNLLIKPQRFLDPNLLDKYIGEEGGKDFYWQTWPANSAGASTFNTSRANINFNVALADSYYLLPCSRLLVSLQVSQLSGSNPSSGVANPFPTTSNVAFTPDSLFSNVSAQIGSTEIADQSGKLTYNYMATHLLKCLTYTPPYANSIAGQEFFYIDSGLDGGCNINPFSSSATVATVASVTGGLGGGTNNNVVVVGDAAGVGAQAGSNVDFLQSNTANGNSNCAFHENPYYNKSFVARASASNNGALIQFELPLLFCYPALASIVGLKNGFNFQLSLFMNPASMMLFSASGEVAGTVIIQNMQLQIPCFTVNPSYEAKLLSLRRDNVVEQNFYTDVQVYQTPQLYTPGSCSITPSWNGILKRKPIAMFFLMQYIAETGNQSGNQNGNIHRYFNFQPVSDQLSIANTNFFPKAQRTSYGSQGGYQVIYQDYLKIMNILRDYGVSMIDYKTFSSTKFFLPYDCRDISDTVFTSNNSVPCDVNLNLTITSSGIAASNANAGLTGTFPGGNAYGYLIVLNRNSTKIRHSPNGISIEANCGSFP